MYTEYIAIYTVYVAIYTVHMAISTVYIYCINYAVYICKLRSINSNIQYKSFIMPYRSTRNNLFARIT